MTMTEADPWFRIAANPYHDQKGRFTYRAGAAAGAGLGKVTLTAAEVEEMQGGSAADHLIQNADGSWQFDAKRQALHDELIGRMMEGKVKVENPAFNVLGGGPASGKSHLVDSEMGTHLRDSNTNLYTNSDVMKENLPEYSQMVADKNPAASVYVHAESSYLARRLQQAGFERGCNVTLDGTGDSSPAKLQQKIANARAHGYSVHGSYVTVPTDVAIKRAQDRGRRTGRFVPISVISNTHAAVSVSVRESYRDFDTLNVFDSRAGGTPDLIFSWDGAAETVHNEQLWNEFLAKGDAPPWTKAAQQDAPIMFSGRGGR